MSIAKANSSNPQQYADAVLPGLPEGGRQVQADSLIIGFGAAIMRHLSATADWDPASLNSGAALSTTVAVAGAAVGDTTAVGISPALPAKMLLSAQVTAADTVTVTLANLSEGAVDLPASVVRVDVWHH